MNQVITIRLSGVNLLKEGTRRLWGVGWVGGVLAGALLKHF